MPAASKDDPSTRVSTDDTTHPKSGDSSMNADQMSLAGPGHPISGQSLMNSDPNWYKAGKPFTRMTSTGPVEVTPETAEFGPSPKEQATVKAADAPKPFDLQGWLNQQLAPYNNALAGAVKEATQQTVPSWVPDTVKPSIQRLQKLTNTALKGLMPAIKATEGTAVQAGVAGELEQLIPSALIYHTLSGNLPGLPSGGANKGINDLWQLFQNINVGLPNPGQSTPTDFLKSLQGLTPPGSVPSGSA